MTKWIKRVYCTEISYSVLISYVVYFYMQWGFFALKIENIMEGWKDGVRKDMKYSNRAGWSKNI